MEDNIAQQIEELEVLESIFGDKWKKIVVSDSDNTYSIQISKNVELWITLNQSYPSDKPPGYELCAPGLTRNQRQLIEEEFREIYELNKGFPIVFQWVEKLKDILEDKTIHTDATPSIEDEFIAENKYNQNIEKKSVPVEECNLEIVHSVPFSDRKSTFQGHVCKITDESDVKKMLEVLTSNKKISQAINVLAYRIVLADNMIQQDFDDGGENHAGSRLLHLMEVLDVKNVAIVVSRWYGGIHLGRDRFRHYNNAGQQALIKAGFIS